MRRHESSGPFLCHDFPLSLREINGPCCSPPEAVFIRALLFPISLSGPFALRHIVRTDYTPTRHCSVPHRGFCTFWKGFRYYSAVDFKHFPSSLMHSHTRHCLRSRNTGCVYNQSPANPHDYRNGTLAHTLSPWQLDSFLFSLHTFSLYYTMTGMGDSVVFRATSLL